LPDSFLAQPSDSHQAATSRARLCPADRAGRRLAEAESWADEGRLTRLRLERGALLDEVSAGNWSRRPPPPVQLGRRTGPGLGPQGVASALHRIEAADPALARLLHGTVRAGAVCRFAADPGRPVRWRLSPAAGDGDEAGSAAG
jgi:hypothetical protein